MIESNDPYFLPTNPVGCETVDTVPVHYVFSVWVISLVHSVLDHMPVAQVACHFNLLDTEFLHSHSVLRH